MESRVVWIAGASGLVGGHALDALLEVGGVEHVVSFGRRPSGRTHPKLEERTADFDHFEPGDAERPDVAVCALGTTIAKAGSKEAFQAVDHDAVISFAKGAREAGAQAFVVVTALGADPRAAVFYNRVKGQAEASLLTLDFPSLTILQPSLLLGDRSESRPGERVAVLASRALAPVLSFLRARPIEARVVGRAAAAVTRAPEPGVRRIHSADLHALGA